MPVKPKVSIGMPVFNGEKYIRDAINSILFQTFTDFELIISDNDSTDDTSIVCKKYEKKDSRVVYIKQTNNIGAGNNFKFLLDNAKADTFMWLASDDYLADNHYIETMYGKLMEGYDMVFPSVRILEQEGLEFRMSDVINNIFFQCKTRYEYCLETVNICSYQVYGLFKKQVLVNKYHYIEKCRGMKSHGEGLFVHALMATTNSCYCDKAELIYRRHDNNVSSTKENKHLKDLIEYTYKVVVFYINETDFRFFERITIIKNSIILLVKRLAILIFFRAK